MNHIINHLQSPLLLQSKQLNKTVLTIATGKEIYIDFAAALARSFLWWNPDSEIAFVLITDQDYLIPKDIRFRIQIISVKPGELGEGFSSKLHLDKLALEGQNLFIDSDCLIFGKIDSIFEKFKGHNVSVIGNYIDHGEWFGDVEKICKQFSVSQLPKFNGGIYYLEKGDAATKVYINAREIEKKYDQIGFIRLRNRPNDEVIMALAMQLCGEKPIADDGTLMSDPLTCQGKYRINVLSGKRFLTNPLYPDPNHQSWFPYNKVNPLVIHFLGHHAEHFPYKRESYRIKKAFQGVTGAKADFIANVMIKFPMLLIIYIKNVFRPLFRLIVGFRKVNLSKRI